MRRKGVIVESPSECVHSAVDVGGVARGATKNAVCYGVSQLTILVAGWSGNYECVGHCGASMRKNPDVRVSHIVCAEVFIRYTLGNYSHYAQTSTICLSRIPAQLDIALLFFFGGGRHIVWPDVVRTCFFTL